jgi:hypothetical protein
MGFMGAVGKIEARYVHASFEQTADHARRIGGRAESADNFGVT